MVNEFKASKTVIRVPTSSDPCKGLDPAALTVKVNGALLAIDACLQDDSIVQVLSAARLQLGDILIHTKNRLTVRWVLENHHLWTPKIHKDFVTLSPSFPVLLQAVPGSHFPGQDLFVDKLLKPNRALPKGSIHTTCWLVKPPVEKEGSVLIHFFDKTIADKVSKGNLVLDS